MRSPRESQICCESSLCQHPDCWRLNLQRVREAVWRRNGIEPEDSSTTRSMNMDQVYLTKEQRLESTDGGLPTLKVVDMFSDLDSRINSAPHKQLRQASLHRRSTSLPSLSPDQSQPTASPQQIRMPHPSPVVSPSARTEYQRKMLWKKQFSSPSRPETSSSRESGNTVKLARIGVHEIYEPDELDQDWEEVYVTSAYLVWCPSNNKRKKRKGSSVSSRSSTKRPNSNKVIPKDVTEDFVPASMEAIKPVRPKSTKTPTGGQPYSPHKSPANQTSLRQYGMEDLSDLPKPILSGMLKRIAQRSKDVTPEQYSSREPEMVSSPSKESSNTKTKKLLDGVDLSADFDSLLAKEDRASKVHLAVDINSRFTTPEEDEEIEKQKEREKAEKEKQETEANSTNQFDLVKRGDDKPTLCKTSRELLRMNSVGIPIEDLPSPKSHHCMNSIPRSLSLGAALEPVNIVPIKGSPTNTPPNEPEALQVIKRKHKQSKKANEFFVTIPHGRAVSQQSPYYSEEEKQYVYQSFRNSPSPVRAPAPTPSSPDKYSEFFRQNSRISQGYRNASLQDDEIITSMRKWNTLSNVCDTEESVGLEGLSEVPISIIRGSPVGKEIVEADDDQEVSEQRIFLTEGFETSEMGTRHRPCTPETSIWTEDKMVVKLKEPLSDTASRRTTSPGSRTRIPKDIIEEFHGNLYGKQFSKAETRAMQKGSSKSKEIVLGPKITASGWRPPRSRTPIQFAETPARFAPRPLRQPPQESVPKSLQIVPISNQALQRPRSTPPRITTPNSDYIAQVLSESSLPNTVTIETSLEAQGPSTNVSGTGSVPPPPSPEALILSNELNMAVSTLEPLCEEDERSSRGTSITEFNTEKGAVNPRLSPLGGGSEISEESIDLPKEVTEGPEGIDEEDDEEIITEKQADTDGPFDQSNSDSHMEQQNQNGDLENSTDKNDLEEQKKQVREEEGLDNEKVENGISQGENGVSSSPIPQPFETSEPKATEITHDSDTLELQQPSEPREARLSESPEPRSPPRGSPEPAPEPAPQPPGSPEVASEHNFTEGVDMNLDLSAELQAAMEGLDDFVLDDDNDDDDENAGDENININDKDDEDINKENNVRSSEENEKNHDQIDDKHLDSNDDCDDGNGENRDDKMIPDTTNDEQNDDTDISQNNMNQVDPVGSYHDRNSPLLDA